MTVSAVLLNEDRHAEFNDFMATHAKGHILQGWEWGEVKRPTGWQPLRVAVERDGKIVAAASILARRLPARLGCIFYSPRGPVVDMNDTEAWQALQKKVAELAKQKRAVFWKCDPDVKDDNELWHKALADAGFKPTKQGEGFEGIQPRYVFRLDISPTEEELLAACHQKTRYNIRLAGKKGVVIKENCPKEDLRPFYEILQTTAARDNFLIRPYSYFEGFYDHLVPAGQAELFMAYLDDKPISGTLAFIMGDKAWYIYGASSNEHRNVMPNYLIQWTMIEWAKRHGCTMYDFRGVPGDVGEDHPLYGLVKFKRGFGGEYVKFIGEYDLVYNKFKYFLYTNVVPVYQKLVRVLIRAKKKRAGK